MAAETKQEPVLTLAPLPTTERGYGIHVSAPTKGSNTDRIAYASGTSVIVRSLANPAESIVFTDHVAKVRIARFSPNGEWIASGDESGKVIIWSVKTLIVKNTVQATAQKVLDIAWSDDGKRVVAVGLGNEKHGKVFPWDSGSNLGVITGHSKAIVSCDFKPKRPFRIATSSEEFSINFHNGTPFKFDHSFNDHTNYPNCVRYSPDASYLVSVGSDRKIFLFDGKDGTLTKELESKDNHKGSIYSVSWSPDSKRILTSGADKTAKVWDIETGEVTHTFVLGKDVADFQVSALWTASNRLFTVALNGTLTELDLENVDTPKQVVAGHNQRISALVVSGTTAYSTDMNGTVVSWDLTTGKGSYFAGVKNQKGVLAASVSASGDKLITVAADDKIRVSEVKDAAVSADATACGGRPTAVAAGRKDNNLSVVTTSKNTVVVFNGGQQVSKLSVGFKPTAVDVSHDDTLVAVGGEDRKVHLYKLDGGALAEHTVMEGNFGTVYCIEFSPDDKYVAAGDHGRCTLVYEVASGKAMNPLGWKFHNAAVKGLSWSPDGSKLVTGSTDSHIILWEDTKEFSKKRTTYEFAHKGGVKAVAFISNDQFVSTGAEESVKVWKIA